MGCDVMGLPRLPAFYKNPRKRESVKSIAPYGKRKRALWLKFAVFF